MNIKDCLKALQWAIKILLKGIEKGRKNYTF